MFTKLTMLILVILYQAEETVLSHHVALRSKLTQTLTMKRKMTSQKIFWTTEVAQLSALLRLQRRQRVPKKQAGLLVIVVNLKESNVNKVLVELVKMVKLSKVFVIVQMFVEKLWEKVMNTLIAFIHIGKIIFVRIIVFFVRKSNLKNINNYEVLYLIRTPIIINLIILNLLIELFIVNLQI